MIRSLCRRSSAKRTKRGRDRSSSRRGWLNPIHEYHSWFEGITTFGELLSSSKGYTPPDEMVRIPERQTSGGGVDVVLSPKITPRPSLMRAQYLWVHGPPTRKGDGQWLTQCGWNELSDVMGRSWAGRDTNMTSNISNKVRITAPCETVKPRPNSTTNTGGGEPIKEWMTSHVHYPTHQVKEKMAIYYVSQAIAQAMRTGSIVMAQQGSDGKLQAAMLLSEGSDSGGCTVDDCITSTTSPSALSCWWWDCVWEWNVTLQLSRRDIPALFRCAVYQDQQEVTSRKAAAFASTKAQAVASAASAAVSSLAALPVALSSSVMTTTSNLDNITKSNCSSSGIRVATDPKTCDKVLLSPSRKHWVVEMVAIDPNLQGMGHGTELIHRLGQLADEMGMEIHLEAAGSKNIRFYQRAGYVTVNRFIVPDPTQQQSDATNHLFSVATARDSNKNEFDETMNLTEPAVLPSSPSSSLEVCLMVRTPHQQHSH